MEPFRVHSRPLTTTSQGGIIHRSWFHPKPHLVCLDWGRTNSYTTVWYDFRSPAHDEILPVNNDAQSASGDFSAANLADSLGHGQLNRERNADRRENRSTTNHCSFGDLRGRPNASVFIAEIRPPERLPLPLSFLIPFGMFAEEEAAAVREHRRSSRNLCEMRLVAVSRGEGCVPELITHSYRRNNKGGDIFGGVQI